uniref:Neuropeptide Y prohormone-3 n=1 Tax=Schmidtea mediterranea TaxID=79327 RepID=E3CTI4_SCHMD|nr:TPA_inf: neuropeptide Y prohormone-3 [Schmidtea mediterranea]
MSTKEFTFCFVMICALFCQIVQISANKDELDILFKKRNNNQLDDPDIQQYLQDLNNFYQFYGRPRFGKRQKFHRD